MDDLKEASQRKLSFFATLKAVFWSFFGVRKKSAYEQDVAKLNPIYVVIAGIFGAVLFITTLILIVKSVVANQ
ncbi:DUF2970 domain-containing protein [Sapientia aquatica]|uniref:DUF2970 domain-containing protein n=1 Tax=Sapientia aquatica TaxID=1549640 RepID=A0A4R5W2L6_9BURK|nr:DUF2970 domain-containing protein [Sapientia aquatica]TDK66635.1 DUF2970 domain-containing protein [Sapientia aquatica]